ncbi:uncharacterized protein LOC114521964 isoform X2 [Dendronephthya gigantea]|nr:uncharacterized protein LOC114521964 isoform X2 [Dendronephthya gigantea]
MSIPLLTCALVAVILHGTAYTHFVSKYQERLSLEDENYECEDVPSQTIACHCTKKRNFNFDSSTKEFYVSCSQQKPLVDLHGALLAFCSVAFALLHGILVISVIFLLHCFELEPAIATTSPGQDNGGFSHASSRQHDSDVNVDTSVSQHPSLISLNIPPEHPPSYESLLPYSSFHMAPYDMTSHIVTYDVTNRGNRETTVNRNARVRHVGQTSSRFNNYTPEQAEQRLSSTNEVPGSNEHENIETQAAVNEEGRTRNMQVSDDHSRTIQENIERQQAMSNHRNTRTDESPEPLETRSRNTRPYETSDEPVFQEESNSEEMLEIRNSSGQGTTPPSQEPSIEHTNEMVTHEGSNPPPLHSNVGPNYPFIEQAEEIIPAPQRSDSQLSQHAQLESTISSGSENGVYFDVTQNPRHNSNSAGATRRISVRYRGHSEDRDPTTNSLNINEQSLDSSILNGVSPPEVTNTDVVATENITGSEVAENEMVPAQVNLSMSLEGSDFHPQNFDTHSINSLEIMSI